LKHVSTSQGRADESLATLNHENCWSRRRQDAQAGGLDGNLTVSKGSEKILSQPEPGAVSYFPEKAGSISGSS